MLINLYNGKPEEEFSGYYAQIAQIFDNMIKMELHINGKEITADEVLEKFNEKISSIVSTVKDKLNEDARKDELFHYKTSETDIAPASASGKKNQQQT